MIQRQSPFLKALNKAKREKWEQEQKEKEDHAPKRRRQPKKSQSSIDEDLLNGSDS